MHVHAGLIGVALLFAGCTEPSASVVAASASGATTLPPGLAACVAGRSCELVGVATVERRGGTYSWASLSQDEACVPLLLSEDEYRRWRELNGKSVRARGTALSRGPSAPDVVQVQLRDRWLFTNICGESDLALYSDTLELIR